MSSNDRNLDAWVRNTWYLRNHLLWLQLRIRRRHFVFYARRRFPGATLRAATTEDSGEESSAIKPGCWSAAPPKRKRTGDFSTREFGLRHSGFFRISSSSLGPRPVSRRLSALQPPFRRFNLRPRRHAPEAQGASIAREQRVCARPEAQTSHHVPMSFRDEDLAPVTAIVRSVD